MISEDAFRDIEENDIDLELIQPFLSNTYSQGTALLVDLSDSKGFDPYPSPLLRIRNLGCTYRAANSFCNPILALGSYPQKSVAP